MSRKYITTLTVFVLCFCLSTFMAGTAFSGPRYIIKLGHNEAVDSVIDRATQTARSNIEKKTNGEIELQLFPAGQLGKTKEIAEMMMMGNLTMAIGSPAHISGVYPPLQIFDIPFILPNDMNLALKIMNGKVKDKIAEGLGKSNIIPISFYTIGAKQYTCNYPIHKPEDFNGLKIRTMASPILVESFKLMGAIPVPVPYFETYTALQLGTVVGEENPIHAIEQMKFYEVQKYLIISNHQPFTLLAYANKSWFESLPENFQSILYEEFTRIVDEIVQGTQSDDKKSLAHIEASGTKIIELTPAERQAFQDKLKPVREKYIEIVGKEGEDLLKILDAETEKYGK